MECIWIMISTVFIAETSEQKYTFDFTSSSSSSSDMTNIGHLHSAAGMIDSIIMCKMFIKYSKELLFIFVVFNFSHILTRYIHSKEGDTWTSWVSYAYRYWNSLYSWKINDVFYYIILLLFFSSFARNNFEDCVS